MVLITRLDEYKQALGLVRSTVESVEIAISQKYLKFNWIRGVSNEGKRFVLAS